MSLMFLRAARAVSAILPLIMILIAPTTAIGQDARIPFPPAVTPDQLDRHTLRIAPLEKVSPGQFRLGTILLNKTEKSVSFPAVVNMDKGLLEYLLVGRSGKTHESLLRTDVEPYNLQLACMLVGLEGTTTPLAFQGDPARPKGDPIQIILQVKGQDGTPKSISPETWVVQREGETQREVPPFEWVFTGSVITEGRLAAQLGGSIVALFHDPAAMVDNASPGGESDKIWFVKEGVAPPAGTPVTVTIKSKQ